MGLTRKNGHRLHRELWDWLVKNPGKGKWEWPRWKDNGGNIRKVLDYCFLCELYKDIDNSCPRCPLARLERTICERPDNPYYRWNRIGNTKLETVYAKQIRDCIKED